MTKLVFFSLIVNKVQYCRIAIQYCETKYCDISVCGCFLTPQVFTLSLTQSPHGSSLIQIPTLSTSTPDQSVIVWVQLNPSSGH